MIYETGRIVSIEAQGVWVETIQRSTCNSCKAEKGCGQSLMLKWGGSASYLWVLLEGRNSSDYQLGDEIQLGIPEDVIVKGSLLIYFLPLIVMLMATTAVHLSFNHEGLTTLSAVFGLFFGGALVRWYSHKMRFNRRLQPVLIDNRVELQFFPPLEQTDVTRQF